MTEKKSIGRRIINWISTSYFVHFLTIAILTFGMLIGFVLYIRFNDLMGLVILIAGYLLFFLECRMFRKSRKLARKTTDYSFLRRWFLLGLYLSSLTSCFVIVLFILLSLAWVGLGVFHYIYATSTINIDIDAHILMIGWGLFMIFVGTSMVRILCDAITAFFRRVL